MQSISIKNSLNFNLSATLFEPKVNDRKKIAVLFPGYLDTKDYAHIVQLGKDLSKKDYVTISFDPTGTWNSEGGIENYTVSQYMRDIQSVIDFAKEEYGMFNEIILFGHSLGGFVALMFPLTYPEYAVTATIACMAPPELSGLKWEDKGTRYSTRDNPADIEHEKEFAVPYSFAEDTRQYDLLDNIHKLAVPKLFIAGEKDESVPPDKVKKLYEKAPEPKEFAVIDGMGHGYRNSKEDIAKVHKEIFNFLLTYPC